YCPHTCTINELSTRILYLSKLRYFSFCNSNDDDDNDIERIQSNITHLHIDSDPIILNNLEILNNENLEVLSFDFAYERESFILKYLPQLEKI
ncbi:unnamed protein product, partial [Adineta steineri]